MHYIARDLVAAVADIMMTGKEADTENGNVAPGIEIVAEKETDDDNKAHITCYSSSHCML